MMNQRFSTPIGERRMIPLMETMGENLRTYGHGLKDKYLVGPYERGDTIQQIMGPFAAAASLVLEGTDNLYSGLVGQKLEQPSGLLGRMTRDTSAFVKDVLTLHPFRAAGDAWRGLTSSLPMDTIDAFGGFHQRESHHSIAA